MELGAELYLAFDTSTPEGAVAAGAGGWLLAERVLNGRSEHSARLIPAIREVLGEIERTPQDLSGIVVGRGPGSFTGVRVAAATAKGLVTSLQIPLYGFSSLAALAVKAASGNEVGLREKRDLRRLINGEVAVCAVFDARGERVYAGCYRVTRDGMETMLAPRADTVAELLERKEVAGAVFVGDGAVRHRERIEGRGGEVRWPHEGVSLAGALLWLLTTAPRGARIENPKRWEPDYLRASTVQVSAGR